jgi:hypothetical protein
MATRGIRKPIPSGTILGRISSGLGAVEQLTVKQVLQLLFPAGTPQPGGGGGGSSGANPTATASDTAVNGVATTFMRSDAAPAVQKASASQFGLVKVDGTTITASGGVISSSGGGGGGSGSTGENPAPTNPGWDPDYAWVFASGAITAVPLTSSNTVATMPASATSGMMFGTPGRVTGKRYFEVALSANDGGAGITLGIGRDNLNTDGGYFGQHIGQCGWHSDGTIHSRSQFSTFGGDYTITTIQTWAGGNTLCIAVDLDARLIWFRTNGGNWNNSGTANPATGAGGVNLNFAKQHAVAPLMWYPGASTNTSAATGTINLAGSFAQSVPSGFAAWSS